MEECGTDQSWQRSQGFSFHSSKFLDQKNHMYSVSLNLLGYFELLAKLHVMAKGVNLKKNERTKGRKGIGNCHSPRRIRSPSVYWLVVDGFSSSCGNDLFFTH